jgi:Na+/proline symporter
MLLIKFAGFAGRTLVSEGLLILPDVKNAQDFVFVYAVQHATQSVFLWGIFAVIILAAVMSTTDRLMLTVGSMFGWDIYRNVLKPDAKDRQVLRVSQITTVIAAVVTLLFALNPPAILAFLIWMGIGVMLSTFAIPLLAGLYWRGATREGAIASMAAGLVGSKLPMHFSIYALIVSLLAMVVVSLMTKKTDDTILNETMTGWYIQPK